jgi:hypothetical protein
MNLISQKEIRDKFSSILTETHECPEKRSHPVSMFCQRCEFFNGKYMSDSIYCTFNHQKNIKERLEEINPVISDKKEDATPLSWDDICMMADDAQSDKKVHWYSTI